MRPVYILFSFVVLTIMSCQKRPDPVAGTPQGGDTTVKTPPNDTDTAVATGRALRLNFNNVVNGHPLVLKNETYTNAFGDEFTVSDYVYYISNIKLFTDDGKEYAEPESYHLVIHHKDSTKTILFKNLPAGNYTRVEFLIGVDSARNTSGAQTGALDPMNGMFWDWNTGYIMARLEGKSAQSPTGVFAYHLGGYKNGGVIRKVSLPLPNNAVVAEGKRPVITLNSDVAEWFKTPNTVSIKALTIITSEGLNAIAMANNYADMFSVSKVENP